MARTVRLIILLCWSLVAACSSAAPVASRSGTEGPVTPAQLVDESMAALEAASSMHVWGRFPVDGKNARLDARLGTASGYGRFVVGGLDIQVRTIDGECYLRGNNAFLTGIAKSHLIRPDVVPIAKGKWLHFPRSFVRSHLAAFTNLTLIEFWQTQLPPVVRDASYQDGGPKIVRGIATSSVFDRESSTFLYFPQTGTPYPVAFSSNAHFAHVNFGAWNEPVNVSVPPAQQTVELTQ